MIDPFTGLLTEGYAVLKRDEYGVPVLEAYFTPTETWYLLKQGKDFMIPNPAGTPLLVPIIHRPDAVRPFGRSRITRACMSYQRYAKRTLERADVTAEFYSFPQKYVLGLSQDAEPMDTWKATVSSMLQFTKDDDGEKPTVGQFTTSNMSPFTEQLRLAAAGFAGEMGLTLADLGFVSDNPSSAEAIRASHENLRLAGRKAQRSLGSGLLNVAYVAACLRDEWKYLRSQFVNTIAKWEPLFEADASTLTMISDGAIKLNQAIPGYLDADIIRDLTGIKGSDKPANAQESDQGKG
ncbi:putative phage portal protein [Streptococcus sanguinis]|uniref:Putative phage portal protein n=1 Tax=Streptococcus sanguinis TaxID=1305 RepID=A0A0B7GRB3_STRSA|nr:putative phage portal protein [Streptococcus sanguinis]